MVLQKRAFKILMGVNNISRNGVSFRLSSNLFKSIIHRNNLGFKLHQEQTYFTQPDCF
jgi:hypothetical protein